MQNAFKKSIPSVLAAVLVVAAALWFGDRWTAVDAAARPAVAWAWVVLAGLILVAHAGTALAIWMRVMDAGGAALGRRQATDIFVPSLLARYVPGKIWANALRLALSKRAGVRYGATTGAILWETLLGLGSAGAVALLCLANAPDPRMRYGAALLLVVALGVWVVARPTRVLARALPWTFLGWLAYGLAHLAIARSIAPVGPADLPLIAGAVALAWAGGYLAFVMPVGLGVRDGLLLVLLAPLLTPAQALTFVALSRLVQLVVDAAITLAWLVTARSAPSA